jgi:hypothetical protein
MVQRSKDNDMSSIRVIRILFVCLKAFELQRGMGNHDHINKKGYLK